MKNVQLGQVDGYDCYILKNDEDLIENEKKVYSIFYKKYGPDAWMMNKYQKIDNCRLKCPFSHFDQVTIVLKDSDNNFVTGSAYNLNMKEELQLEMKGFSIDEFKENYSFLEGLYFYSTLNANPLQQLSTMLKWKKLTLNYFKEEMNRQVFFGTCHERLIKFLKLFDYEFYDSLDIGYSAKYFLFKYFL